MKGKEGNMRALRQASEDGDLDATVEFAWCLVNGADIDKDVSRGIKLYELAANAGNDEAAIRLGLACEVGSILPRNSERAADLYREAAGRGSYRAMYLLGLAAKDGTCVSQDDRIARKYLLKARHHGHLTSAVVLNRLYRKGRYGLARQLLGWTELLWLLPQVWRAIHCGQFEGALWNMEAHLSERWASKWAKWTSGAD